MSLWNFLPLLKWELLFCVFWTFDGPYQICELTSSLLRTIATSKCCILTKNIYLVTIGIESCLLVCVTSCLLGRTILLNICISANVFVLIIYVRMLDQMLSWLLPACHISFVLSITIVTLHYHGVQYTFLILPPSSRSQNHKLDAEAELCCFKVLLLNQDQYFPHSSNMEQCQNKILGQKMSWDFFPSHF